MSVSATYDDRAALQREVRGSQWFVSEATTSGRDDRTGLELDVDATGWPVRVTKLASVPDQLRTVEALRSALDRATGAAVLAHLAANAERRNLSRTELERGRDLMEGRRKLVPPPAYRAEPLVPASQPVQPRGPQRDERLERVARGVSREGELRVELGWVDGLRRLEADPEFLRTADPDLIRHALNEAFTAAQEGTTR